MAIRDPREGSAGRPSRFERPRPGAFLVFGALTACGSIETTEDSPSGGKTESAGNTDKVSGGSRTTAPGARASTRTTE